MFELIALALYRKANRQRKQLDALQALQTATPVPLAQAREYEPHPPCTRVGCQLKFNHGHI